MVGSLGLAGAEGTEGIILLLECKEHSLRPTGSASGGPATRVFYHRAPPLPPLRFWGGWLLARGVRWHDLGEQGLQPGARDVLPWSWSALRSPGADRLPGRVRLSMSREHAIRE